MLTLSSCSHRCAICMMDYTAGEPIRLLPCMHYYHLRCIDDWLMRSLTCPTCMERVDTGLMTTLGGLVGNTGGSGGRSRGFSLRRRRRVRGQGASESESPLMSSSRSSSRSSSTSSSTEHLSPRGPISWQGPPRQLCSPQGVVPNSPGPIFLPPFPTPTSPRNSHPFTDVGPLPRVVSPPSTPGVVVIHSSPPHSPVLPNITIHTSPSTQSLTNSTTN